MGGFVVEILPSLSKPAPGLWLVERRGRWSVVSAFGDARVFATEDEARAAADKYCRGIRGVNYRIVRDEPSLRRSTRSE
jgi:hypothetical protein